MTMPTLYQVSGLAVKTVKRFPLAVLTAYSLVILGIVYNHNSYEPLIGYVLTGAFAFAVFLAVDTFMEAEKVQAAGKYFGRLLALGLIGAAYYYIFRDLQDLGIMDFARFFVLIILSRLLVFLAPFTGPNKANAFWQYTVILIIRMFQTVALFAIFFLGIVLFLAAVNYLFQIDFESEYYVDIWFVIAGIFASVFFLAGVPANPQRLEQSGNYPKFLRILAEYFLVPLVFLYLLVLYLYSAKILFTWQWPPGEVSSWITGFSIVGLVAYFLAYSAKEKFLNYVEFFKKWFFILLLPLLVVLGLAVGMRIMEYGWTPDRYFVAAFGIWVLIMAVFYIATRSKNLKFMAFSLFVILALSIYGPQSAFGVSQSSQLVHLENLLSKNSMIVNGKILKFADISKISTEDYIQMTSIVWYLAEHDGLESLQPWFNEDLALDSKDNLYWNKAEGNQKIYWSEIDKVFGLMGFEASVTPLSHEDYKNFYAEGKSGCFYGGDCFVDVSGYNYYLPLSLDGWQNFNFDFKGKNYVMEIVDGTVLGFKDVETGEVYLNVNLKDFSEYLLNKFPDSKDNIPFSEMTFEFKGGELRINSLAAYFQDGKLLNVDGVVADLLLK